MFTPCALLVVPGQEDCYHRSWNDYNSALVQCRMKSALYQLAAAYNNNVSPAHVKGCNLWLKREVPLAYACHSNFLGLCSPVHLGFPAGNRAG